MELLQQMNRQVMMFPQSSYGVIEAALMPSICWLMLEWTDNWWMPSCRLDVQPQSDVKLCGGGRNQPGAPTKPLKKQRLKRGVIRVRYWKLRGWDNSTYVIASAVASTMTSRWEVNLKVITDASKKDMTYVCWWRTWHLLELLVPSAGDSWEHMLEQVPSVVEWRPQYVIACLY